MNINGMKGWGNSNYNGEGHDEGRHIYCTFCMAEAKKLLVVSEQYFNKVI
jgi:hypothetical protein